MKLKLGCGEEPKEDGWTYLDISDYVKPDIIWDLERGLPPIIQNDSCEEIMGNHIFEHIRNFEHLLFDCWRALAPDGLLKIRVPNVMVDPGMAFTDPTHVRYFTPYSFDYYCGASWHEVYKMPTLFEMIDNVQGDPECKFTLKAVK